MKKKREKVAPKVLIYFAENRKRNKWEIKNHLKISYASIFDITKKLLDLRMIQVAEKQRAEKNPNIEVEYYELTLTGLLAALGEDKRCEYIDITSKNYPEMLPLVLGKWGLFKRYNQEETAKRRLQETLSILGPASLHALLEMSEIDKNKIVYHFTSGFLMPRSFEDEQEKKWVKVCVSDPEIKSFLEKFLRKYEEERQNELNEIRDWERFIVET